MADNRLDDAIDRAVRDMVTVEPDAQTTARVMMSIESPRIRAFDWRYVAAAGALAILFLAVMLRTPEKASIQQAAAPSSAPAIVERPVAPTSVPNVPEDTARPAARVTARRHAPPTVAPAAGLPDTIPPLEEIRPIVTRPPQTPVGDLEPDAIVIAPMGDLPEIAEPPGGRDERPR